MKKLLAITLTSILIMAQAFASVGNGIGGSSGGSNSMDWGEILNARAEYRTHFPSIYYNGMNIGIDNLCDNGADIVTAKDVPVRVKPNENAGDAPKILEYQRVRIPRWRLITAACKESLNFDPTSEMCMGNNSDSSVPLRYKVKVEAINPHTTGNESFEKEYTIPTCDEWDYIRNQVNASDFWESFTST